MSLDESVGDNAPGEAPVEDAPLGGALGEARGRGDDPNANLRVAGEGVMQMMGMGDLGLKPKAVIAVAAEAFADAGKRGGGERGGEGAGGGGEGGDGGEGEEGGKQIDGNFNGEVEGGAPSTAQVDEDGTSYSTPRTKPAATQLVAAASAGGGVGAAVTAVARMSVLAHSRRNMPRPSALPPPPPPCLPANWPSSWRGDPSGRAAAASEEPRQSVGWVTIYKGGRELVTPKGQLPASDRQKHMQQWKRRIAVDKSLAGASAASLLSNSHAPISLALMHASTCIQSSSRTPLEHPSQSPLSHLL